MTKVIEFGGDYEGRAEFPGPVHPADRELLHKVGQSLVDQNTQIDTWVFATLFIQAKVREMGGRIEPAYVERDTLEAEEMSWLRHVVAAAVEAGWLVPE